MNAIASGRVRSIGLVAVGIVVGASLSAFISIALLNGKGQSQDQTVRSESLGAGAAPGSRVVGDSALGALSASNSEAIRNLSDISSYPSDSDRKVLLHSLVGGANEAQLSDMLGQLDSIGSANQLEVAEKTLIQRLASLNPKRAMAYVNEQPGLRRDQLTSTVFGEWASTNLDEAVAHAGSVEESQKLAALRGILNTRDDLSEGLQRQIAKQLGNEQYALDLRDDAVASTSIDNPDAAWNALINDAHEDIAQLGTFLQVAKALVDKEGVRALNKINDSTIEKSTRNAILLSVLHNAAQRDPQGAFQEAMFLDRDAQEIALPAIVRVWAGLDPLVAFNAVSNLNKSSVRSSLLESLIAAWAENDPQGVFDSLELLPERLQAKGEEQAMLAIARSSPANAIQFLSTLEDSKQKRELAKTIATNWSQIDVYEALDWATSSQLTDERMRHDVLAIILRELAAKDPELAFQTALIQPIGKDGRGRERGLEADVVAQIARADINKALEMLSLVRDGYTLLEAYRSVGKELVMVGEYDRALKLGEQLPEDTRSSYFNTVLNLWAQEEPEVMFDSIASISNPELRTQAAVNLLTHNALKAQVFDDDQIKQLTGYLGEKSFIHTGEGDVIVTSRTITPDELSSFSVSESPRPMDTEAIGREIEKALESAIGNALSGAMTTGEATVVKRIEINTEELEEEDSE